MTGLATDMVNHYITTGQSRKFCTKYQSNQPKEIKHMDFFSTQDRRSVHLALKTHVIQQLSLPFMFVL
jgi:hypothetical protein